MLKNKFLKRVVSSSLISAIFLNSSFITRAGVLVENKSYKTQENLKCEQKVNKNKNEKNNFSETLKDFLLYGTVGLVGIGGTGCLIYEAVELIKNWCNESDEEPEEKAKETPKPIRLRKDSPFACLMQHCGNCYINSTLHILHMDPEFRKYVKGIANNCKCDINEYDKIACNLKKLKLEKSNENIKNNIRELEERLEQIKYKSLDLVFEDMDKEDYRGYIVPHSDAKKTFEKAIGHHDWDDPLDRVFGNVYNKNVMSVFMPSLTNENGEVSIYNEFKFNTLDYFLVGKSDNSGIWYAFPDGDSKYVVPTTLNLSNGNNYELKGFVYGGSGHYYCYKMGDNHVWYHVDGYGDHNDAIYGNPPLKMRTKKNHGVTLAYYQKVK